MREVFVLDVIIRHSRKRLDLINGKLVNELSNLPVGKLIISYTNSLCVTYVIEN